LRVIATVSLAYLVFMLGGCGGGSSSSSSSSAKQGPLAGNWQITLTQEIPAGTAQNPLAPLSVSGFLLESNNSLTGSVALPGNGPSLNCAGVGPVTGTISGQSVAISVDESGSTLNLTGAVSSDSKSMAGTYQTLPGGCTKTPTSGTWAAFQIPPLNGNFTGTLANSNYMAVLTGVTPPAPISVSGMLTETSNVGESTASLSGTITAVGYPCFATASVTGTISGQSVFLSVFAYNGDLIGSIGSSGAGHPAIAAASSNGASLTGEGVSGKNGLFLGIQSDGCPAITDRGGNTLSNEIADVALTFQ
jgi:hypothetical protein